ncbi:MAG: phosphate signaling complex protein PhoU [Bacteroidia bacterium]|nr:phosphate signaling complex protein PhoU [Bacteroidia bacterium]
MNHLETEIVSLKRKTVEMWQLVYSQVDKSQLVFSNFDKNLIQNIKINEKMVDTFELMIDIDCENILALYSPVAVDLRFVLTVLKINYNLERIGDYANGVSKLINDLENPVSEELLRSTNIIEMFNLCKELLKDSLNSFETENNWDTRNILGRDKAINKINKDATIIVSDYIINNPEDVMTAMNVLSAIRKLERVGDHIQNIAEELIFFMEAKIIKHQKKSKSKE